MVAAVYKKHRLYILVVDDYPDNSESLAMLLRLDGHKVDVAYDGPQALEIAEAKHPEVVLCDITMPIMPGYEVAKRLRRRFGENILLIAISAHGFSEDKKQSAAAGFDFHLVKPANPTEVQQLLQHFSG